MSGIIRFPVLASAVTALSFLLLAAAFFAALGKPPIEMLRNLVIYAVGDAYSVSQTFAKTTPILLCALAVAVPGRLGPCCWVLPLELDWLPPLGPNWPVPPLG